MRRRSQILWLLAGAAAVWTGVCFAGLAGREPKSAGGEIPGIGGEVSGFVLKRVGAYGPLEAQTLYFEHEKSGAGLLYLKNGDENRTFSIAYRTPQEDETDANHALEHGILASSRKYPSKDVFFDLTGKTYHTFANAYTFLPFTAYPVSSRSEEQLLRMADVYLSCMAAPGILEEEKIFQREAVRYELRDEDAPISVAGTVYGEDLGQMTSIEDEAFRNILQALYPGERAANVSGRAHLHYQELTYGGVLEVYEKFYRFDNSLMVLYGDLDYRRFLAFLDEEYLSSAPKGSPDREVRREAAAPSGYVERTVFAPACRGDNTRRASLICYAMDLDGQPWEVLFQYEVFASVLQEESSLLGENLRSAGLSSPWFVQVVTEAEKPFFLFGLQSAEPEDAAAFRAAVDGTLREAAESGLDENLTEAVLRARELQGEVLLENPRAVVEEILPLVYSQWAQTGETDAMQLQEAAREMMAGPEGQEVIRRLAAGLGSAGRSALVTTVPKPGLAEEILQRKQEELTERKASMTREELRTLMADTLEFDEWNAARLSNSDFAIPVESLPALPETPLFTKTRAGSMTLYASPSEPGGLSLSRIYFDTGAVPQEALHDLALYALLLEELPTEHLTKGERDALAMQYLGGLQFRFHFPGSEAGEHSRPMLSATWYGRPEDYEAGLALLLEMMGNLKLEREEILEALGRRLPALDLSGADALGLSAALAEAALDPEARYREWMGGQAFYYYGEEVRRRLEEQPEFLEELRERLSRAAGWVLRQNGLVVMNAAPLGDLERMAEVSKAALSALPSLPAGTEVYRLPDLPGRLAVISSGARCSTRVVADPREAGELTGAFFPFVRALSDQYTVPRTRFQGGAYSGGTGFSGKLDRIYTYTTRDPAVGKTLAAAGEAAEALGNLKLTQEELDTYILSAYAVVTAPQGELSRRMEAMERDLEGFDWDAWRRLAAGIRTARVENQAQAARTLGSLWEEAVIVTAGNGDLIEKDAACFDRVEDYRPAAGSGPGGQGGSGGEQGRSDSPAGSGPVF